MSGIQDKISIERGGIMSERMTVSYQKKPCYDIIFEKDFQALSEELKALDFAQKKLCIITDSNVGALYVRG